VKQLREYVVCAVLKNVTFTPQSYNSFIDFQEKLHSGLARRRTLASVGTHDLDKLGGCTAFRYTSKTRDEIQFVPLNQSRVLDCSGNGLEQFYKDDRHISKYVPLVSQLPRYPVVLDDKGAIMSLPPIINSDFSKISLETKNIFIETTAPDHHKASVLVNQIVCAFSSYCAEPFTVEAVRVEYADREEITPKLEEREMTLDVPTVNRRVGIDLKGSADCAALLNKMFLYADALDEKTVRVGIPACRSDVLHPCDLVEDVAIAFGYENMTLTETPTRSNGSQTAVNKLGHLLRLEVSNAGYTEVLTFSLCSRDEAFRNLGREDRDVAVHIANPQTVEFQVCRPSLLPGLLKTLQASKSNPLPLKLFEVSDVVLLDNGANFPAVAEEGHPAAYNKCGGRNRRHFGALHCTAEGSGFEDVHGLVEYVMMKIGVPQHPDGGTAVEEDGGEYFYLREGGDGAFFPGRAMDVVLKRKGGEATIGHLGALHPNTLKAFEIPFSCSYCEINVQPFV